MSIKRRMQRTLSADRAVHRKRPHGVPRRSGAIGRPPGSGAVEYPGSGFRNANPAPVLPAALAAADARPDAVEVVFDAPPGVTVPVTAEVHPADRAAYDAALENTEARDAVDL